MPATPTSPARIAANRQNALRSTGPKTVEGKARSRANSVKHGLTGAGIALPNEDAQQIEQRFAAIQEELAPQTVLGSFYAHQMALMTVRAQRSTRHEAAALAACIRQAEQQFATDRAAEVNTLIVSIVDNPVHRRPLLLATPEGTNALIQGLLTLQARLTDSGPGWNQHDGRRAVAYFGIQAERIPSTQVQILTETIVRNPESRAPAAVVMRELIQAEVERLQAHRATLDHAAIAQARAEAVERALFDFAASKAAGLVRRYEAASSRELSRALREFRLVEADVSGDEPEALPDAAPIADPAPVAVAVATPSEPSPVAARSVDPTPIPTTRIGRELASFGKPIPASLLPTAVLDISCSRHPVPTSKGRRRNR